MFFNLYRIVSLVSSFGSSFFHGHLRLKFLLGWIGSVGFNVSMRSSAISPVSNGFLVSATFIGARGNGCWLSGPLLNENAAYTVIWPSSRGLLRSCWPCALSRDNGNNVLPHNEYGVQSGIAFQGCASNFH